MRLPDERQRPVVSGAPRSRAGQAAGSPSTLAQQAAAGTQPTPPPAEAAANGASDDNALPVAFIIRVTPTRTTRLVVVMCPFCSRLHVHGWPYRSGPPGTRVAHCRGAGLIRSYRIEAPR